PRRPRPAGARPPTRDGAINARQRVLSAVAISPHPTDRGAPGGTAQPSRRARATTRSRAPGRSRDRPGTRPTAESPAPLIVEGGGAKLPWAGVGQRKRVPSLLGIVGKRGRLR